MLRTFETFDRVLAILSYGKNFPEPKEGIPWAKPSKLGLADYRQLRSRDDRLPLKVSMEDELLVIEAPLPGVHPDNIEVLLDKDTLTISGRFPEKSNSGIEGSSDSQPDKTILKATMILPKFADSARAKPVYENGLLTITIPKFVKEPGKRLNIYVKDNKEKRKS